jgi:hypothetical protein
VGIELISAVIPICCGLPLAIESFFLVTELATPLGIDLPSKGLSIFSSYIALFPLCFLSYHSWIESIHSVSNFFNVLPLPSLVLKDI